VDLVHLQQSHRGAGCGSDHLLAGGVTGQPPEQGGRLRLALQSLRSSFLLAYELVSTSFVYFGVNDERRQFDRSLVRGSYPRTGLRVFFKLSYLLRV
jgi:hypothetical protein